MRIAVVNHLKSWEGPCLSASKTRVLPNYIPCESEWEQSVQSIYISYHRSIETDDIGYSCSIDDAFVLKILFFFVEENTSKDLERRTLFMSRKRTARWHRAKNALCFSNQKNVTYSLRRYSNWLISPFCWSRSTFWILINFPQGRWGRRVSVFGAFLWFDLIFTLVHVAVIRRDRRSSSCFGFEDGVHIPRESKFWQYLLFQLTLFLTCLFSKCCLWISTFFLLPRCVFSSSKAGTCVRSTAWTPW